MIQDWVLETLLEMDGEVHEIGGGLWYKIDARKTDVSPFRPHGIKYSLTLHDRDNHRLCGIDNAHGLKKRSASPGQKRREAYDHRHEGKDVRIYEYRTAEDLLNDFFEMVEQEQRRRGLA